MFANGRLPLTVGRSTATSCAASCAWATGGAGEGEEASADAWATGDADGERVIVSNVVMAAESPGSGGDVPSRRTAPSCESRIPSRAEGFGPSPLSALSLGVVILTVTTMANVDEKD